MKYLGYAALGLNVVLALFSLLVVYRTGNFTWLLFGLVYLVSSYKIVVKEYSLGIRIANLILVIFGGGLVVASFAETETIYVALPLLVPGAINIVLLARYKKEAQLSGNPFA